MRCAFLKYFRWSQQISLWPIWGDIYWEIVLWEVNWLIRSWFDWFMIGLILQPCYDLDEEEYYWDVFMRWGRYDNECIDDGITPIHLIDVIVVVFFRELDVHLLCCLGIHLNVPFPNIYYPIHPSIISPSPSYIGNHINHRRIIWSKETLQSE